ncbi:MAG TPA: hypothetical protein VLX28_20915 [Thermoanaerobaculia bacterium]|nr:hypothetical protein [Thermoanaerobaculia bacterium]
MNEAVSLWLGAHPTVLEAQFVLKAWLDAGGEKDLVKEAVSLWLGEHGTALDAQFVLTAWLDAGGEKDLVKEVLSAWLEQHAKEPVSGFVIRAWLEKKGDFSRVRQAAIQWLSHHRESLDATFVIKFLARQPDLPTGTVQDILAWCRAFPLHDDALWRLTSLERYLLGPEIFTEVLATCDLVVGAVVEAPTPSRYHSALTRLLFSILGEIPELRSATQSLFQAWLRHPAVHRILIEGQRDDLLATLNLKAQGLSLLLYLDDLIARKVLNPDRDRKALARFFAWIATWKPENKDRVRAFLAERAELLESSVSAASKANLEEGSRTQAEVTMPWASDPERPLR